MGRTFPREEACLFLPCGCGVELTQRGGSMPRGLHGTEVLSTSGKRDLLIHRGSNKLGNSEGRDRRQAKRVVALSSRDTPRRERGYSRKCMTIRPCEKTSLLSLSLARAHPLHRLENTYYYIHTRHPIGRTYPGPDDI